MLRTLLQFVHHAHNVFIKNPLRTLYFHGPTALGFWGGAATHDICFSLTNTPSNFWEIHPLDCQQLCEQKFNAFSVAIIFIMYIVVGLRVLEAVTFHMCFTRPILTELRKGRGTQARITHAVEKHP